MSKVNTVAAARRQSAYQKQRATTDRLSILLNIWQYTTNHLREENEDILLAAIFEAADLGYEPKPAAAPVADDADPALD